MQCPCIHNTITHFSPYEALDEEMENRRMHTVVLATPSQPSGTVSPVHPPTVTDAFEYMLLLISCPAFITGFIEPVLPDGAFIEPVLPDGAFVEPVLLDGAFIPAFIESVLLDGALDTGFEAAGAETGIDGALLSTGVEGAMF